MKLLITGSPGTGKTTVARKLSRILGWRVVNEKDVALKAGIAEWDHEHGELEIPLDKLKQELEKLLKEEENIIIEGHLLCEIKLNVDKAVLLRVHPEILEERLERRGYNAEKLMDNVFCEGIDYCKKHLKRRYPKEKIVEVKNEKSVDDTVATIMDALSLKDINKTNHEKDSNARGFAWLMFGLALAMITIYLPEAYGKILYEKTLSEMGYEDFVVSGPDSNRCTMIEFASPPLAEDAFAVFSLLAEFMPTTQGTFSVTLRINDTPIAELKKADDFTCNGTRCWHRAILPKDIVGGENKAEICVTTGNTVSSITIRADSKFGHYKMAVFKKDDFVKHVEKYKILVGEDVRVTVSIHNSGTEKAYVRAYYKPSNVKDVNVRVRMGNTEFQGIIAPGETKEFSYIIRFNKPGHQLLYAAYMEYENVFGEMQTLRSNYPGVYVYDLNTAVKAELVGPKSMQNGDRATVSVLLKNMKRIDIKRIDVELTVNGNAIVVEGEKSARVDELIQLGSKALYFKVKAHVRGESTLGCKIKVLDDKNQVVQETPCRGLNIRVTEPQRFELVILVAVLIIAGIVAYIYIIKS